MDAIAEFKSKALDSMQQTVDALTGEVTKARTYLDRVRAEEGARALAAAGDGDVHL